MRAGLHVVATLGGKLPRDARVLNRLGTDLPDSLERGLMIFAHSRVTTIDKILLSIVTGRVDAGAPSVGHP